MAELDDEARALLGEIVDDAEVTPNQDVALVGGAYDAADRTQRMLGMWHPAIQSADMDSIPEKYMIDARARDSIRNDAYVRGGQVIHQDNIVGARFMLNSKPAISILGMSEDQEVEFQEEVEERWHLYAESPDCWIDAARRNTFTEMVRLAVGVHTAGGEALASAEWLRNAGRPYSTAVQMIDTDRLSNPANLAHDHRIVAGVERNMFGAPIRYHIRNRHPADWRNFSYIQNNMTWRAVNARKPWGRIQIIHIFEQFRPDQTRGVTEMVTALKEIRMTKKFRDIELQNAIVNATYAAAIESDLPSVDAFTTIGGVDNPGEALGQYVEEYLSQIADYSGGAKNLQLDGVKIPHLFPGTKLNLMPAGKGGALGQQFEQSLLRYIAASLGVSYEQLSRDYSSTNYSSARAAMAETYKRMTSIKRMVADRFATHVYRLWLEEAVNKGVFSTLPQAARQDGWLYAEPQRLDALARCEWIGASKGQIDPLKETQAATLRLGRNLTTLEEECAGLGLDWRYVLRQRRREVELEREYGIATQEDPNMMNSITGDPRDPDETDNSERTGENANA